MSPMEHLIGPTSRISGSCSDDMMVPAASSRMSRVSPLVCVWVVVADPVGSGCRGGSEFSTALSRSVTLGSGLHESRRDSCSFLSPVVAAVAAWLVTGRVSEKHVAPCTV